MKCDCHLPMYRLWLSSLEEACTEIARSATADWYDMVQAGGLLCPVIRDLKGVVEKHSDSCSRISNEVRVLRVHSQNTGYDNLNHSTLPNRKGFLWVHQTIFWNMFNIIIQREFQRVVAAPFPAPVLYMRHGILKTETCTSYRGHFLGHNMMFHRGFTTVSLYCYIAYVSKKFGGNCF